MSEPGRPEKAGPRAVVVPLSSGLPGVPVETKLHAPSVRGEWVERRALISDLAATAAKLVLIEAPAGFGKTTLAAMLGALPLLVGNGTGSELRRPLGLAIIGGLLVSQVLTLFTTPVIYLMFDRLSQRFGRKASEPSGGQAV